MDQVKIGKFIAECRKKNNLTQMQLAEKLNITDRAVSKWENGKSLPDAAVMLDLCGELKISVTELLRGEEIDTERSGEEAEKALLEMKKKEEEQNKKLMTAMWTILISNSLFFTGITLLAVKAFGEGSTPFAVIMCVSTAALLLLLFISLRFEVAAGYYECKHCHYKFVPTYKEVMMSVHLSTTRRLRCPNCHKKSWAKKVMAK